MAGGVHSLTCGGGTTVGELLNWKSPSVMGSSGLESAAYYVDAIFSHVGFYYLLTVS
jgi:hypothetical protein